MSSAMVKCYILIQTDAGHMKEVVRTAAAIPGVVSAEELMGPYDVILQVQAQTLEELTRNVVSRVQLIEGIHRSLTCPVITL